LSFIEFDGKNKFKKRKREENDPNEDAKLLRSNGYEEFLNENKKDTKKMKSSEHDSKSEKFGVKFEKKLKSGKTAKFVKFSNKKKK